MSSPGRQGPEGADMDFIDILTSDESNFESDTSEYGKSRRGKRKSTQIKKGARKSTLKQARHATSPPDMSDIEYDKDSRSGSPQIGDTIEVKQPIVRPRSLDFFNNQYLQNHSDVIRGSSASDVSVPHVVQLHLDAGAAHGGTTINLDLSKLLLGKRAFDDGGARTLRTSDSITSPSSLTRLIINNQTGQFRAATPVAPSKRIKMLKIAEARRMQTTQEPKKGFVDLPYELRIRIYRQVFVTEAPIDFSARAGFARSSAFLRTCRLVHHEGSAVLYGENAFHFERSHRQRGAFFEAEWKEIGFKDVRRFLETIGTLNLSKLRYVSFQFVDAAPSTTPHLEDEERRFVNDPVLHHVLKLLGSSAQLSKIAFTFLGRRQLTRTDVSFLQALSSIKAEEVIHAARMSYQISKVREESIVDKLKKVMTVRRKDDENVDHRKRKEPTVRMYHEKPKQSGYHGGGWL